MKNFDESPIICQVIVGKKEKGSRLRLMYNKTSNAPFLTAKEGEEAYHTGIGQTDKLTMQTNGQRRADRSIALYAPYAYRIGPKREDKMLRRSLN